MSTRRLQARNEINVTPLIDVILQLIIFFMITTTFRSAPGISLDLPQSKTAQKVASSSVLQVRVFSNDEIYVNKNKTSLAGLRTILQQAVATMGSCGGAPGFRRCGSKLSGAPQTRRIRQTRQTRLLRTRSKRIRLAISTPFWKEDREYPTSLLYRFWMSLGSVGFRMSAL